MTDYQTETVDIEPQNRMLYYSSGPNDGIPCCTDLLAPRDPSDTNVLLVSITDVPTSLCRHWHSRVKTWPNELGIITSNVGYSKDEWATRTSEDMPEFEDSDCSMTVKTVSPADLTTIGIRIAEFLRKWEDSDKYTAVCFDSVTSLEPYVSDTDAIVEFVKEVGKRASQSAGHVHFHIDPTAVSDQLVSKSNQVVDTAATSEPSTHLPVTNR